VIKNLTPRLPEMGKIKAGTKGEDAVSKDNKKFRLPKKLDHYIITTTERDDKGNLILDNELMETLKKSKQAIVDKDGNLTGIPIRLLYNSIDLNFYTRYACYVGGKCVCSGDGEKAHTRDGRDIECPCKQLDSAYQGKDKCKANGRLICIIEGAPMVGACHVLRTTSINTVQSILGGLAFIKTAAGGMLAFLPLLLILKPKTITIPATSQLSTVYVSSIIYNGPIVDLQRDALAMAKEKAKYLIEMDTVEATARELLDQSVESEQEQLDVQQEFYPDAIDVTPDLVEKKEKKPEVKKPGPEEEEKPETKPKPDPDPPAESESEPESKEEDRPITKDQKRQIVKLKKENKISDPAVWQKLLKPFGVKTANDLTEKTANEFIEALKKNPT